MPAVLTRRGFVAAALYPFDSTGTQPQCSAWVFGLLKPRALRVHPSPAGRLHCVSNAGVFTIEGRQSILIDAAATPVRIAGPNGAPVPFVIEIPNVIRRTFIGTLEVDNDGLLLIPIVSMTREIAVSSIVGAELPTAHSAFASLAAQAVAARSFLTASTSRHGKAAFCDTTHCQFLRSPAIIGSPADRAVQTTRGLVLFASSQLFPARYSAACGGHTDTARLDGYRYESVDCEICRVGKTPRSGHGLGLCQQGAIGLAQAGWNWQAILAKYYRNASITSV